MNNAKNTTLALLGVIIISAIAYAVYGSVIQTTALLRKTPRDIPSGSVACTMDAFRCGDGSWVGRSGPNCQFVCPIPVGTSTPTSASTVELALNQTGTPIQETLTVLSIVEDSRCPIDVQCIQAGTVRVQVKIGSGLGTSVSEISLGKSVTTESEEITFVTVRPEKESQKEIAKGDYRFVFRVTKK